MAGSTCVRLGVVVVLLVGLLGIAALTQSSSRADDPAFQPKMAAFFKEQDKVQIAVFLENKGPNLLKGSLQVDLVSDSGARIASREREIRQEEPIGRQLFTIPVDKTDAGKWTVHVLFQGKRHEARLAKVLLAKVHETTANGGVDFAAGGPGAYVVGVQGVVSATETMGLPGAESRSRARPLPSRKWKAAI